MLIEREPMIDIDDQDNANDVAGKPYGLFVMENGNHKFVCNGRSHAIAEIDPFLVNWIMEQLCKNDSPFHGSTCIELFYECKKRGILYCSHPDYCSMGPWHDWVMVTFAMHGNCVVSQFIRDRHCEKYCFQPNEYPCKFLAC